MRLKRSSVPADFPSASASSAKDNPEEKGKHFLTMVVQDLYKRLVQKLDLADMTSTTKRNLKVAGIVLLGLLVVLVALPFLINVRRPHPDVEHEAGRFRHGLETVENLPRVPTQRFRMLA